MVRRDIYLEKRSLEEALLIWEKKLDEIKVSKFVKEEEISSLDCAGRIASREVHAKKCSPLQNVSAVDGFAVRVKDTLGCDINNPKYLKIGTAAKYVNTGEAIESSFNAVVMVEDVEIEKDKIRILKPLSFYENVRTIGEDIVTMDVLVRANEKILPQHIGALIQGGVDKIHVKEIPRVLIIPTGEEIIKPFREIHPLEFYDSNSYMIREMLNGWGASSFIYDVLPNNEKIIMKALEENYDKYHLFVILGGSAKGSKDFVPSIIKSAGELLIHGVSIQPGKPIALGLFKDKPIVGMPGYPVSSFVDSRIFLKTAIEKMLKTSRKEFEYIKTVLKRPVPSEIGTREYIRVKLTVSNDTVVAVPIKGGASPISSVSNADGILVVPENLEGFEEGAEVDVELLVGKEDIQNQILFIGSNDPVLEKAFNIFNVENAPYHFGVINSGSFGGLLSLERGECQITATHLFDESSGTYNEAFIRKVVSRDIIVYKFLKREQGLMLRHENSKRIKSIEDITKPNVAFVNRQKGSGTRVFLDYILKEKVIDTSSINGYENEEFTHIAVASAVKEGIADCGMGIRYVADIFGLEFIPVQEEDYDLVFTRDFYFSKNGEALIKILESKEFKDYLGKLKGYKKA